jgi:hypothetical protein
MTHISRSTQFPERLRNQAVAALVPFFIDGPRGNTETARLAAAAMLDDFDAATPKELQLSAEIIALAWAAIGCLRTAMAATNLPLDDVLRLQDHAIGLDQSSQKATRALEARRKERARNPAAMTPENTRWDEGAFQLAINQSMEKLADANARLAASMATPAPAERRPKPPFLFAERMTRSVLAHQAGN